MISLYKAPIKFYHLLIYLILVPAGITQAHAADGNPGNFDLPLQFDPAERIAKPDLAPVARIRFLTTVDFPPFNFIDQSGKLSGFNVDLAREACRELKVMERCQIEALPFADLTAALERGEGEVVAAGVAVTPELRKSFGFSRVYMQLPARFAVRRGPDAISGPNDLKPESVVGVQTGTRHEEMFKMFFPDLKSKGFADRAAMLAALKDGTVAAVFADSLQLGFWVSSKDAENCCQIAGGPYYSSAFLGEGMTLMLKDEDATIRTAMDYALLTLARNGKLQEIYLRYFPNGL